MASQITTSAAAAGPDAMLGDRRPAMTGELNGWFDRSVLDVAGEPIGLVVDIAPDLASGRPGWLVIYAGLRDTPIVVAPVRGASRLGEHIVLAHARSVVASAPAVDDLGALSDDDQRSLSRHYTPAPSG